MPRPSGINRNARLTRSFAAGVTTLFRSPNVSAVQIPALVAAQLLTHGAQITTTYILNRSSLKQK